MLNVQQIRQFYLKGFMETFQEWPGVWRKQFKIRMEDGSFMKLNTLRSRLNLKSLIGYCVRYPPVNLYFSVLNWMMPERVGKKRSANRAYPIGGEYVIDIDSNLLWRPHSHWKTNSLCIGCLTIAYDMTLTLIEKILENYSDVQIVFSGKRGFHIHVLDFEVRDWTYYNGLNPLKSHEVARFLYTKHLKTACGGFDHHHFALSSDVMRVITVPGSLNGGNGLICKYIGGPKEFMEMDLAKLMFDVDAKKYTYSNGFQNASLFVDAHPEPSNGGR